MEGLIQLLLPLALLAQLFFIARQDEREQIIANKKILVGFCLFWPLYLLEAAWTWRGLTVGQPDLPPLPAQPQAPGPLLSVAQPAASFPAFLAQDLGPRLIALAGIFALFFLLSCLTQGAIGMGDAKLAGLVILYLGFWTGMALLFLAFLLSFFRGLLIQKKAVPLAFQAFLASAILLVLQLLGS